MIRLLLRYLANNEELVKRLSESYPVQQAARFVVSVFYKGKGLAHEHDLHKKMDPNKLREMLKKFSQDVKSEIEEIKRKRPM